MTRIIVATDDDEIAELLRCFVAQVSGFPIIEKPSPWRARSPSGCESDGSFRPTYMPVAELLAMVYRLKNRGIRA